MPRTSQKTLTLPVADLKEFIEAAEEVCEEARSVEFMQYPRFNALHHLTEDRFERALETLKFALTEAVRG